MLSRRLDVFAAAGAQTFAEILERNINGRRDVEREQLRNGKSADDSQT
jgi:hypothetical protein